MNKYIRKLGFRSSDDMEMKVTLQAIKYSWLYAMAFVACWSVIHSFRSGEIPFVHVTLMLTAYMLFFALQWFFTRKTARETEESHVNSKRLSAKGKGKNSYEYVYEDEEGNQYIYEEVEVDE